VKPKYYKDACIFCKNGECEGCPLPADPNITLREFLEERDVPLENYFFYEEPKK